MPEVGELKGLVEAAVAGDAQAFNELYQYSFPTVEGECLKVLHSRTNLDDAMQEAYIKIYKNLDKLKEPEKFLGWCRHIAHNEAVTLIASRDRKTGQDEYRPVNSTEEEMGLDLIMDFDADYDPEQYTQIQIANDLLQMALDDIPKQQAEAFLLNLKGYKYTEIAEQLDIPVGTAKSNVRYAKKRMEKEMSYLRNEEQMMLNGYVLGPAGKLILKTTEVTAKAESNGGWIGAETAAGDMTRHQEKLWKKLAGKLSIGTGISKMLSRTVLIIIAAIAIAATIIGTSLNARNTATNLSEGVTKELTSVSTTGRVANITAVEGASDSRTTARSETRTITSTITVSSITIQSTMPQADYRQNWDDGAIE